MNITELPSDILDIIRSYLTPSELESLHPTNTLHYLKRWLGVGLEEKIGIHPRTLYHYGIRYCGPSPELFLEFNLTSRRFFGVIFLVYLSEKDAPRVENNETNIRDVLVRNGIEFILVGKGFTFSRIGSLGVTEGHGIEYRKDDENIIYFAPRWL